MNATLTTSTHYLLPVSLENLHRKTVEWQSSLEFWTRELDFFKKLLDTHGAKLKFRHNILEREHLTNLLHYYSGNLMTSLAHALTHLESRLKVLHEENGAKQDESFFREEHKSIEHQIHALEKEMKAYKGELFNLIEKVLLANNQN